MSATTPVSELPKIPTDIAEGVTRAHDLKHVSTEEKNVLPSKEDIVAEKTHQELTEEIAAGTKLRSVSTDEKNVLPSKEDIAREKTLDAVSEFPKVQLKHVEPHVTTLPVVE